MAIDYRERSFASKNKPRRPPVGKYVAGILVAVLLVFAAGFIGGWSLCWYKMKKTVSVQQQALSTPVASPVQPPLPAVPKGQQTPLTFYETLPGGKTVIGSGINAGLTEHQPAPAAKPSIQPQATPPAASVKPSPVPQPAAKPQAPVAPEKPVAPQPVVEKKFAVQVASVKDKAEAESLRSKLAAKGLNPTIYEVKVPEKGIVFRVRAGRHLSQSEAKELAAKLGSGAIVIAE
ncbi:SPOR domain-containing protein [Geobacter pelophilus]|uniref:SPOR domain-containing protein n=1 Tax=Geoanaerobacter pelophilus TaxID=60036 RepID=A0AAW4L496_9BACT|nr:SPOR domain-containing protein [Geoanaerobacter pelophilus]MBT0665713.1 SPOR domain-containing protein [Geoanaerobacter pelophilus]